jgi:hypothetical protein
MKIFSPVRLYVSSPFGTAFVRSSPRSVPQCDSVRHIVPDQSPLIMCGKYVCFCSSVACSRMHAIAPFVRPGYMQNELLADASISEHTSWSDAGSPCPP